MPQFKVFELFRAMSVKALLILPLLAVQAVVARSVPVPFLGSRPGAFPQGSSPTRRQERAQSSLLPETERRLRQAVQANPQSFEANHYLGEFYINAGKLAEGLPYLEKAQRLDPAHYVNGYDLALAYLETNKLVQARQQVHSLLQRQNLAELHNLLGEIEEQQGDYVRAANEYQVAARMDPSESHIFDWGNELLLHRAFRPAMAIFKRGAERYPQSAKLHIGLGVALYSQGLYDDAARTLCRASDLEPSDQRPYLFLGKMFDISVYQAREVTERLKRFVQLQPQNALAHFYYAMSLWKGGRTASAAAPRDEIEAHLKRAVTLHPSLPDPHLQLGSLYTSVHEYAEATREYKLTVQLNPDLADAHYHLAQAYLRRGERMLAKKETERYERLHKQEMLDVEKKRIETGQFIYSLKDNP